MCLTSKLVCFHNPTESQFSYHISAPNLLDDLGTPSKTCNQKKLSLCTKQAIILFKHWQNLCGHWWFFSFFKIFMYVYIHCVCICAPECHGAYVQIEHAGTGCLLPGGSKDLMQVKVHGKHLHLLHHQTRLYRVQLFLNWAMDHKEQEVHDGSCTAGFSLNPTHWSSHNVCISEMHQKCPMLTCSRFLFHIKSWESPKEERIRP